MHTNTHRQSPKHPVGWVIITFRDQVNRSKLKKLGLIHEIDARGPQVNIKRLANDKAVQIHKKRRDRTACDSFSSASTLLIPNNSTPNIINNQLAVVHVCHILKHKVLGHCCLPGHSCRHSRDNHLHENNKVKHLKSKIILRLILHNFSKDIPQILCLDVINPSIPKIALQPHNSIIETIIRGPRGGTITLREPKEMVNSITCNTYNLVHLTHVQNHG